MSFFSTTTTASSRSSNAVATTAAAASAALESTGINEEGARTPHYHFIHSMILPSTLKIQKELKGRKFKVRYFAFTHIVYVALYVIVYDFKKLKNTQNPILYIT